MHQLWCIIHIQIRKSKVLPSLQDQDPKRENKGVRCQTQGQKDRGYVSILGLWKPHKTGIRSSYFGGVRGFYPVPRNFAFYMLTYDHFLFV